MHAQLRDRSHEVIPKRQRSRRRHARDRPETLRSRDLLQPVSIPPGCRRAECKGNRAKRWKAKCASVAKNRKSQWPRMGNGSYPSDGIRGITPRRSRRWNSRRNQKISDQRKRSHLTMNRARRADQRNQKCDRPNRPALYRRSQIFRTNRGFKTTIPPRTSRIANPSVLTNSGEKNQQVRFG